MATERHLWVNLASIRDKEKAFLLDTSVSNYELFGNSVEAMVVKFREAKARSATYNSYTLTARGPGLKAWPEGLCCRSCPSSLQEQVSKTARVKEEEAGCQ